MPKKIEAIAPLSKYCIAYLLTVLCSTWNLLFMEFVINNFVENSMGKTPFELVYIEQARSSVEEA